MESMFIHRKLVYTRELLDIDIEEEFSWTRAACWTRATGNFIL